MILFFGDTQLQADRPIHMDDWDLDKPSHDIVGEMCKTLYWIAEMIDKKNPDTVVFTGDLNEELGKLSLFSIYAIKQGMEMLIDDNRRYIFMLGNHDIKDPAGVCNSHILLPNKDNVQVVLPGQFVKVDDILITSYTEDTDQYMSILNHQKWETVVMHMPIKGMQFTTGYTEDTGVDLTGKVFKDKVVISGHYHKPYIYTDWSPTLITVGAPMYHDFRDEWDSERGILLLKDSGEVEWAVNPYTSRYIKVSYPDEKAKLSLAEERAVGGLHVRAITEDIKRTKKILEKRNFASLRVLPSKKIVETQRVKGMSIDTSFEEEIPMYVDRECPEELDNDRLSAIGIQTVREAK